MVPGGSTPLSKGLSSNSYSKPKLPNRCFHTYFFKIHSTIVLQPMRSPSWRAVSSRLTVQILKALLYYSVLANVLPILIL